MPRLGEAGLALGPMVVVAKRGAGRWGTPRLEIDGNEKRILALLAAAYWQPVRPMVIDQFRAASKALARGQDALAAILVAQAGLGRLDEDERIAFRLFAAEKLIDAGLAPRALMKGLGLDPWPLDAVAVYNPQQRRVPKGQTCGGQWTIEEGNAGDAEGSTHPSQSPKADAPEVPRPDLEAIAKNPTVAAAIDKAWADSGPGTDLLVAREHGFYIVANPDGTLSTVPMEKGTTAFYAGIPDLVPPPPGAIAWFHTHPVTIGTSFPPTSGSPNGGNAAAGPSVGDMAFSNHYSIPGILKGSDGLHYFGPALPQSAYGGSGKN